jgi:hypothetical protein
MNTREEYKNAIQSQAEMRMFALKYITQATLDDFDERDILRWANEALTAYRNMTRLKEKMREIYSTQCTCQCVNHRTEA